MNVTEQIDLLIELQKLDSEIYKLARKQKEIPLLLTDLDRERKRKTEKLKSVDNEIKALLMKERDRENDLASKEETIKKCQTQLYQIKTNKEYRAMQQEIEAHIADKSVLEDEIITIMDEIEARKILKKEAEAQLARDQEKIIAEKNTLNSELKDAESRLNSLNAQRAEQALKVDKQMLGKYERILKGKDGLAMVPLREDSCSGCHLNLPPQVMNEIKMKKGLVFCESCARILYIER